METTKIALFKGRKIRRTLHNNEWWFAIYLKQSKKQKKLIKNG